MSQKVVVDIETGEEVVVDLTPEEEAQKAADEAAAALAAVRYTGQTTVDARLRTTDDVAVEVFRFPTETKHLYQASLTVSGIDATNGVSKLMEGRFVWKRPGASAVMVGVTVVSDIHDAAAASWTPAAAAQATDIVFTVKGAVGRTIDWALGGQVSHFAPEGYTPS
jgi:hypothetical protein